MNAVCGPHGQFHAPSSGCSTTHMPQQPFIYTIGGFLLIQLFVVFVFGASAPTLASAPPMDSFRSNPFTKNTRRNIPAITIKPVCSSFTTFQLANSLLPHANPARCAYRCCLFFLFGCYYNNHVQMTINSPAAVRLHLYFSSPQFYVAQRLHTIFVLLDFVCQTKIISLVCNCLPCTTPRPCAGMHVTPSANNETAKLRI